jgi:hypothetical protein
VPLFLGAALASAPCAETQGVKITGEVEWQDAYGKVHPARGVRVVVADLQNGIQRQDVTDELGGYAVVFPGSPKGVAVRAESWSRVAVVRRPSLAVTPYGQTALEVLRSGQKRATINVLAQANGDFARSLSIVTAMTYGWEHVNRHAEVELPQVDVVFPADSKTGLYGYSAKARRCKWQGAGTGTAAVYPDTTCTIALSDHDFADWDVILHEYGHQAAISLGLNAYLPGATSHAFNKCMSPTYNDTAVRGFEVAWSEGWPTYFAYAVQNADMLRRADLAGNGDALYVDVRPDPTKTIRFPLDAHTGTYESLGEDNEASIARILFDLADGGDGTPWDDVGIADAGVWSVLRKKPTTLREFWGAVLGRAPVQDSVRVGRILAHHRVGPLLVSPEPGTGIPATPPAFTFKWINAKCGWSSGKFQIVFRDADWNVIGTSTPFSDLRYSPDQALWNRVRAAAAPVRWMLYGSLNAPQVEQAPYLLMTSEF